MKGWVNIKDGLPDCVTECLVAVKRMDAIDTHKKLAEWDGTAWVDVDGEVVNGVVYWMKAPSPKPETVIEKLIRCVENDKCENQDCCYFAMLNELKALRDYLQA